MAINVRTIPGQLAAAKGTLYTVPAKAKVYVKSLSLFNTGGVAETVKLYVNPDGTSRRIPAPILAAGESSVTGAFALEEGDLIEGESTNANVVDYVIDLMEDR
jgi:hypothetical protein